MQDESIVLATFTKFTRVGRVELQIIATMLGFASFRDFAAKAGPPGALYSGKGEPERISRFFPNVIIPRESFTVTKC